MAKRTVEGTAAMPAVKFTPVKIGGETYDLAFKLNALAEAEKIIGLNLLEGIGAIIAGGMNASQFRALLYAGLQKAHSEITLEGAGDLLDVAMIEGTAGDIREALLTSYGVSFTKTVPPEADPPAENRGS
jgi:hypothetical protein